MVLAADDAGSFLVLMFVFAGLAHWLVQSVERMKQVQPRMWSVACVLATLTGIAAFFFVFLERAHSTEEMVPAVLYSIFTGVFAVFGWYAVTVFTTFAWIYIVAQPFRFFGWIARRRRNRRSRKRQTEPSPEERQRRQRVDEEKRRREQEAQKRRQDARMACQLLYDQHAAELAERFPRERLQEYFEQYLSDDQPPEEVERRAERLRAMITESLGSVGSRDGQFSTVGELAEYFQQQRAAVEALDCEEDTRDSLISTINQQEQKALWRFFGS